MHSRHHVLTMKAMNKLITNSNEESKTNFGSHWCNKLCSNNMVGNPCQYRQCHCKLLGMGITLQTNLLKLN